ncbi:unnamed protein product [Porites lobata]|uniref:Uncharacterized protein n=1 Tax=Porites lobata TaxID=104759 RepID=A0ABN8PX54_9CNID|nr:unnamed protein product [Porites lobata]
MASKNITSDSGISLFPEKQKTQIAVRVAQSSSDSEGSSYEGTARDNRSSRRTSRIPIQGLHQSSVSDVSEDGHEKTKPTVTDSGINLKQGQVKKLLVKESSTKTSKIAPFEGKRNKKPKISLSPRETRASTLRKQAQIKKTSSLDSKKNKKLKTTFLNNCDRGLVREFTDDELHEKGGSEIDEEVEKTVSKEEKEAHHSPFEMDNEHSLSEDTPSFDASLLPLSPETAVVTEMSQIGSHQDKRLVAEFNGVVEDDQVTCENNKYVGSIQLKEQLAVDRKEEEVENNYSDDSFEEGDDEEVSSSIEERTPTFEFNLSPPSINISECKDSNQSLGQEKIPRDNEDDTISDISDLENQPVSCEESTDIITRGSLRRRRSSWALFDDDPASETECKALRDEMFEDCETIEYERQHYFGDAEMGSERKHFDDEELDRMDDEIFGLLRPSGQSSRASIVFPGDDIVGSQRDTSSRKRRVRIAIEPEVFLVPFSSREFEEPFFEDTENTPEETEKYEFGPWKNMSLDLFYEGSEERKDDGDDCIEEDIPEEICTDDPRSENDYNVGSESNGLLKQGSLSTNVEDTQITPDVTEEGNGSVGADELMKGISVPTVQRHLDFKTDPQSKAFADDLDDLLDSAEEEIQAAIRCGKINLAAKEHLHLPSEISGSKEEDLSHGIENPPVSIQGRVHLPDDEGKKDISMDEQDSLRRREQEEIPEESISEEINLEEFDIGTQSFFITSTVVTSKDETFFNTTVTDELKLDGKGLLKPVTEHEHHSENNSDDIKGNDQVQKKDICLESNSDTIPCQKMYATESIAFKVRLDNAEQKEFQTMKEGTETDIIQEDYVEQQKTFDEQAASMTFGNGNVLKAAQGYGSGETFHSTEGEDDDKECGPAVSEQNSRDNENASHHGFVTQEKGEHLIRDDSLYNVTDQAIDESSNTRKDCEIKKVKTTMPEVLKKSAYTRTKSFSFENGRAGKKVAYSDDQYVNDLHAEIKALRKINDQLRYELNDKDEEKYTIECMINSANIENEKLMEQLDNLESEMQTLRSEKENTELELNRSRDREMETSQGGCSLEELHQEFKALKSYNKELEIQLEENSNQRRNMDFVVEQVNLENESLLERLDGLESELKEAAFSKRALEAEITECKESLEQKKYENESLSQELEKLKDLHARTDSKILELSGKKAYENLFGESDTATRLKFSSRDQTSLFFFCTDE